MLDLKITSIFFAWGLQLLACYYSQIKFQIPLSDCTQAQDGACSAPERQGTHVKERVGAGVAKVAAGRQPTSQVALFQPRRPPLG